MALSLPSPIPKGPVDPRAQKVTVSQGGHAPGISTGPAKPKGTKPSKPNRPLLTNQAPKAPAATPTSDAMGLFQTTLAQIRALQTPVNQTAITQPYTDAATTTGQLGQGLSADLLKSGQTAQDQYNAGRNDALQHASTFGISSGAGADNMVQPGELDGNQILSSSTQASSAAALQAASAWQALLARTAAHAVSAAQATHDANETAAETSLAGTIPSMVEANKTLAFQKASAKQSNDYLESTLTEKQREAQAKIQAQERGQDTTQTTAERGQDIGARTAAASLKERTAHDIATVKGATARAQLAQKNKGIQGIPQVLSILKTGKAGTAKKQTGWKIAVQTEIPGQPGVGYGSIQYLPTNNTNVAPPGFVRVGNQAPQPVYSYATTGAAGLTQAAWDKAVGVLMIANKPRGMTHAQAVAEMKTITPRPPA